MMFRMSYVHSFRTRFALLLAATTLALLIPRHANAQFDVNQLAGKTHAQVVKMLGPAVQASGTPVINYARFKTAGAIDTIVWYRFDTGIVSKAQVLVRAQTGETYQQMLKRYHLTVGASPSFYNLAKPNLGVHNSGPIPGSPWRDVLIGYLYVVPWQTSLRAYCKANHLVPTSTYFWTIQVQNGGRAPNAMNQGGMDSVKTPHKGGRHKK